MTTNSPGSTGPPAWKRWRRGASPTRDGPDARADASGPADVHRTSIAAPRATDSQCGSSIGLAGGGHRRKTDCVSVRGVDLTCGKTFEATGDFLVGCDGQRSFVRESRDQLEGIGAEDREFLGGRMLATFFRSPKFYSFGRSVDLGNIGRSARRNSARKLQSTRKGLFVLHTQLPRGTDKSVAFARS